MRRPVWEGLEVVMGSEAAREAAVSETHREPFVSVVVETAGLALPEVRVLLHRSLQVGLGTLLKQQLSDTAPAKVRLRVLEGLEVVMGSEAAREAAVSGTLRQPLVEAA